MLKEKIDILDEEIMRMGLPPRKTLIPEWIRILSWIFLFAACISVLVLIFGITGESGRLSLYGLESNDPLSISGIGLLLIYLFKGVTALGIITAKRWAVLLAIIDAVAGIIICSAFMIYHMMFPSSVANSYFRLEMFVLIPYLVKMLRIRTQWEKTPD